MRKGFCTAVGLAGLFLLAGIGTLAVPAASDGAEPKNPEVAPESGLLLTRTGESDDGGRRRSSSLGGSDPVRRRLVNGTLAQFSPEDGESLPGRDEWQWKRVEFDDNDSIEERGSYLYAPVVSDRSKVLVLHAAGQSETYVNGEPRGADIYNHGYVHLPVLVNEGKNHLLFRSGRGQFKVRLYEPPAPVFLHKNDTTLPDLVATEGADTWGAVVIINASTQPAEGLTLAVKATGLKNDPTAVPSIPPLSVRKVGFHTFVRWDFTFRQRFPSGMTRSPERSNCARQATCVTASR